MKKLVVGKIYTYNPDGTKKGLEVKYRLNIGGILQFWFPGTDSWYDWIGNFTGVVRTIKIHGYKYQRKWYKQSEKFFNYFIKEHHLKDVASIKAGAHSAGCPQLLNFLDMLFDHGYDHIKMTEKPALFASPLRRNKDNNDEVIGNRGDWVLCQPTFWKNHTRIKWTGRKKTWNIIKNHLDYNMSEYEL